MANSILLLSHRVSIMIEISQEPGSLGPGPLGLTSECLRRIPMADGRCIDSHISNLSRTRYKDRSMLIVPGGTDRSDADSALTHWAQVPSNKLGKVRPGRPLLAITMYVVPSRGRPRMFWI
ncbi:hypothetical protein BDW59DRAFT_16567 [Aspergillus cavernicola]|uniref:Uncharacterized protein n=1 Tax=Aspergillus cavernicola TaxID=176166 RepID=A0ABR4HIF9_9EURO